MGTHDMWKEKYADAMLELERGSIQTTKIAIAQLAIQQAERTQHALKSGRNSAELRELADAAHILRTLQRVELSKSDSAMDQISLKTSEATL